MCGVGWKWLWWGFTAVLSLLSQLLLYSLIEVSTNESLKCSVFLFDEKSMTDTIECVRGAAKDSMKAATISY